MILLIRLRLILTDVLSIDFSDFVNTKYNGVIIWDLSSQIDLRKNIK